VKTVNNTSGAKPRDLTLVHVAVNNPKTVPAGPLYVAAALTRAGYAVDFMDCAVDSYWRLSPQDLAAGLRDSADVIGISCMSDTLPFVVAALEVVKAEAPGKTVVLGGPGPTGAARELIETFPSADIVAFGEGEATMLEVMKSLKDGGLARVKGICFREGHGEGDRVVTTPPRDRIRDLDDLGMPLYEAVDVNAYPMVNIVFSRGCPYRCTFCDVAPMWKRKNLSRSPASVIDEIKFLKRRYGRTRFEFTDETFVLGKDKVLEFCEGLKREGLDVKWSCTGRVNLVTRELLKEMEAAGCQAMFFGIESGSDTVLERITKDFTAAEAVEALHTTLEYMRPVASFIWGFPFETDEDLTDTLLLMLYLSQVGVDCRLSRLAPFPLMPLYEEYGDSITWCAERGSYTGRQPFELAGYPPRVVELVRQYPKIFPSFYCFATDQFAEKTKRVAALGSFWQTAEWSEGRLEQL
jgi:anaerobic magnesium-protoporphyrin IX monomethyl ester cyclase